MSVCSGYVSATIAILLAAPSQKVSRTVKSPTERGTTYRGDYLRISSRDYSRI